MASLNLLSNDREYSEVIKLYEAAEKMRENGVSFSKDDLLSKVNENPAAYGYEAPLGAANGERIVDQLYSIGGDKLPTLGRIKASYQEFLKGRDAGIQRQRSAIDHAKNGPEQTEYQNARRSLRQNRWARVGAIAIPTALVGLGIPLLFAGGVFPIILGAVSMAAGALVIRPIARLVQRINDTILARKQQLASGRDQVGSQKCFEQSNQRIREMEKKLEDTLVAKNLYEKSNNSKLAKVVAEYSSDDSIELQDEILKAKNADEMTRIFEEHKGSELLDPQAMKELEQKALSKGNVNAIIAIAKYKKSLGEDIKQLQEAIINSKNPDSMLMLLDVLDGEAKTDLIRKIVKYAKDEKHIEILLKKCDKKIVENVMKDEKENIMSVIAFAKTVDPRDVSKWEKHIYDNMLASKPNPTKEDLSAIIEFAQIAGADKDKAIKTVVDTLKIPEKDVEVLKDSTGAVDLKKLAEQVKGVPDVEARLNEHRIEERDEKPHIILPESGEADFVGPPPPPKDLLENDMPAKKTMTIKEWNTLHPDDQIIDKRTNKFKNLSEEDKKHQEELRTKIGMTGGETPKGSTAKTSSSPAKKAMTIKEWNTLHPDDQIIDKRTNAYKDLSDEDKKHQEELRAKIGMTGGEKPKEETKPKVKPVERDLSGLDDKQKEKINRIENFFKELKKELKEQEARGGLKDENGHDPLDELMIKAKNKGLFNGTEFEKEFRQAMSVSKKNDLGGGKAKAFMSKIESALPTNESPNGPYCTLDEKGEFVFNKEILVQKEQPKVVEQVVEESEKQKEEKTTEEIKEEVVAEPKIEEKDVVEKANVSAEESKENLKENVSHVSVEELREAHQSIEIIEEDAKEDSSEQKIVSGVSAEDIEKAKKEAGINTELYVPTEKQKEEYKKSKEGVAEEVDYKELTEEEKKRLALQETRDMPF